MRHSAMTQRRSGGPPICGLLALLATIGAALSLAVLPAAALAASPPTEVQTEPAEVIPGGAKLKGELNPGGLPTTYYFVYARDTCDEGCTPSKTAKSGPLTGDTAQEVPAVEVTGLSGSGGSERYWYYLVASNADGTVEGGLVNFTPGALPPSIGSESVSNVTEHDATLEAQIETNGRYTGYEFQLYTIDNGEYNFIQNCPFNIPGYEWCSEFVKTPPPGLRTSQPKYIPAGSGEQSVSLDLASIGVTLDPGSIYHYRVLAADTHEVIAGPVQTFTTPPSASPSEVVTGAAEATPTGYKLTGKLNPGGLPTTYYFQYIGNNQIECVEVENCWPQTAHIGPITGDTQQEITPIEVTGLTVGVTYRYRLVASNANGTVSGHVARFTVGSPPVIDSVSLSHLTSTDATLEATIDTEGLSTSYAFDMWSSCAHERCEYIREIPLPSGTLLGSFLPQSVSLDLNSASVTLNYGAEYGWGITATSAAGHTSMSGGVFEPPPPTMIEPLTTNTSPLSGAAQPAGSSANTGGQPAASGDTSSSSTPGVHSPGPGLGKTTKIEPFENGPPPGGFRSLSKALKLCEKKSKSKRPSCKRQAEKKYAATGKHHG